MTTGQFWDMMWELPWYKCMWFAFIDDIIVFCKLWWIIILFILLPAIAFGLGAKLLGFGNKFLKMFWK